MHLQFYHGIRVDVVFSAQECVHKGKTYQNGDSFPDEDNCNTCKCVDGGVQCTKKFCPGELFIKYMKPKWIFEERGQPILKILLVNITFFMILLMKLSLHLFCPQNGNFGEFM